MILQMCRFVEVYSNWFYPESLNSNKAHADLETEYPDYQVDEDIKDGRTNYPSTGESLHDEGVIFVLLVLDPVGTWLLTMWNSESGSLEHFGNNLHFHIS